MRAQPPALPCAEYAIAGGQGQAGSGAGRQFPCGSFLLQDRFGVIQTLPALWRPAERYVDFLGRA